MTPDDVNLKYVLEESGQHCDLVVRTSASQLKGSGFECSSFLCAVLMDVPVIDL